MGFVEPEGAEKLSSHQIFVPKSKYRNFYPFDTKPGPHVGLVKAHILFEYEPF